MSSIVHFEIPPDDIDRAKKFYTELFNWKIQPYEGQSEYWLIKTSEEKAVEGGMMKRQNPSQPITNYIDVVCLNEYAEKVKKIGGRIIVSKTPVPGQGYFAVCMDTENNVFGLWETDPEAGFFKNSAEIFIAIMAAVISADEKYSVDEMREVWNEIEPLDIIKGHEFKALESQVFKYFNKNQSGPEPFTETEIDLIIASARKLFDKKLIEQAFKSAVKLAHTDKNIEGYTIDVDQREQAVLDRFQKGFEISDQETDKIIKSLSEKY